MLICNEFAFVSLSATIDDTEFSTVAIGDYVEIAKFQFRVDELVHVIKISRLHVGFETLPSTSAILQNELSKTKPHMTIQPSYSDYRSRTTLSASI